MLNMSPISHTLFRGNVAALALICFIFPQEAHAYLDPGTGSYILQMAIAALLAGLFSIKLFWNKIKIFFKNLFSRDKNCEETKDK